MRNAFKVYYHSWTRVEKTIARWGCTGCLKSHEFWGCIDGSKLMEHNRCDSVTDSQHAQCHWSTTKKIKISWGPVNAKVVKKRYGSFFSVKYLPRWYQNFSTLHPGPAPLALSNAVFACVHRKWDMSMVLLIRGQKSTSLMWNWCKARRGLTWHPSHCLLIPLVAVRLAQALSLRTIWLLH